MTPAIIWLVLGLLLIISELIATSIIAVFLGLGALATSFLAYLGWVNDTSWQLLTFSLVSLATLIVARRRLKEFFVGTSTSKNQPSEFLQQALGQRVEVVTNFDQGKGRVKLNGVEWTAFSEEELQAGTTAWVVYNRGIELYVSSNKLNSKA